MFSYSFAIKLTDRKIDKQTPAASFQSERGDIRVEKKEDDVLLISSDGYSCEEDAKKQLVFTFMKVQIALLKLRVPHQHWLSFNTKQRDATKAIGMLFGGG